MRTADENEHAGAILAFSFYVLWPPSVVSFSGVATMKHLWYALVTCYFHEDARASLFVLQVNYEADFLSLVDNTAAQEPHAWIDVLQVK